MAAKVVPGSVISLGDLDPAKTPRMINVLLCDQVTKVHASVLDRHLFDYRPALRIEALPYQDQIPFTYRMEKGARAMVEAWERVGRICVVDGCEALSKAQSKDKDQRRGGFFDHYYASHIARGWCSQYFCPHPKCRKLCNVRHNLESHFESKKTFDQASLKHLSQLHHAVNTDLAEGLAPYVTPAELQQAGYGEDVRKPLLSLRQRGEDEIRKLTNVFLDKEEALGRNDHRLNMTEVRNSPKCRTTWTT